MLTMLTSLFFGVTVIAGPPGLSGLWSLLLPVLCGLLRLATHINVRRGRCCRWSCPLPAVLRSLAAVEAMPSTTAVKSTRRTVAVHRKAGLSTTRQINQATHPSTSIPAPRHVTTCHARHATASVAKFCFDFFQHGCLFSNNGLIQTLSQHSPVQSSPLHSVSNIDSGKH